MKKIEKAINKYNLTHFDHYFITQEGFESWRNTSANNHLGFYYNAMLVFKNNKLIKRNDNVVCDSWGCLFFDKLHDSISYITIDSVNLDNFLNEAYLFDINNNKYVHDDAPEEYTILIYWATFTGRLNKTASASHAQCVSEAIEETGLKANVFYVNLDIKEDWVFPEKQSSKK